MVNPLTRCVEDYALPPYEQMRPTDIAPALRTAIDEMILDLNSIEDDLSCPDAEISWEEVMDRLEIIDDPLRRLWDIVSHLCSAVNEPELRSVQTSLQAEVLQIQNRRAQSFDVYRAMQRLRAQFDEGDCDYTCEQQRILDRALLAAQLRGVCLVDSAKDRFNAIHFRLHDLRLQFANNLMDATKAYTLMAFDVADVAGVPLSTLALLAQNAMATGHPNATATDGPWKLSLDLSAFNPIMQHCSNRHTRETLYRASIAIASQPPHDNRPVVHEIVRLRLEQAQLLGFSSFAQMSLMDRMAPDVACVHDLLERVRDKCYPTAEAERHVVEEFARAHGHTCGPLQPWDVSYWTEQLRQAQFHVDNEVIKSYFPFSRVLNGLMELSLQVFGVRIEAADGMAEVWHPDVRHFQMRAVDEPGEPVVAQFYLDPYARPGEKRHGSWMNVIVSRSKVLRTEKADVRLPVFNIVCNQTPPVGNCPDSLMSFSDVQSLFRRFGYGLQIALTTDEYTAASGMDGVEWDATDIPASFLGHFCYAKRTIQLISGYVDTGEPLPSRLYDKLVAGRNFMAATKMLQLLYVAALDMAIHSGDVSDFSMDQLQRRLHQQYSVTPMVEGNEFLCRFSHVFEGLYAAGMYRWADVLSADAYACMEDSEGDEDLWRQTGRKYRDTMLRLAGVCSPMAAFELFRGRPPNPDALLKQSGLE